MLTSLNSNIDRGIFTAITVIYSYGYCDVDIQLVDNTLIVHINSGVGDISSHDALELSLTSMLRFIREFPALAARIQTITV